MTNMDEYLWATAKLDEEYDYLAPDGSEIRLLPEVGGGGLSHCTLPVGASSQAVSHKTVDEVWYFFSGQGQLWRKCSDRYHSVLDVEPGISVTTPCTTAFQFRSTGDEPLCILIATLPRWPGHQESTEVEGYWK